jgi:ComEC/Rec2-related protein
MPTGPSRTIPEHPQAICVQSGAGSDAGCTQIERVRAAGERGSAPWGPLLVVGAVIAGILAGHRGRASPGWPMVAVAALAGAAALIAPGWARRAIALIGVAALAAALTLRARDGLEHSALTRPVADRELVVLRGRLVSDPDTFGRTARVEIRAAELTIVDRSRRPVPEPGSAPGLGPASRPGGDRHVLLRASGGEARRIATLAAASEVVVFGRLGPLNEFDAWMWRRHVVGTLEVIEVVDAAPARSPVWRLANAVRRLVLAGGASLPSPERGLLAGFLIGDTRSIPPEVTDQFRAAGLSHLLAVSGANLAFVLGALRPLLRRGSWRTRWILGVSVVVLFGTVTRWEPSVLRASAMAMVAMSAAALGRPVEGLRILALAATALLLVDPFLLHSVGFLLSVGASVGILVLSEPIRRRLPGPAWFTEVASVTLAAQVGVAPVLLPVFGTVSLVSIPANVLAVPAAGAITVLGLVSGVLGGLVRPWWPAAADAMQWPVLGLLRWVEAVAAIASRHPGAVGPRTAWALLAGLCAVAAVVRARTTSSAATATTAPGGAPAPGVR